MIKTTIDSRAGFCFGVDMAIKKAEEALKRGEPVYCPGEMVHNAAEVQRLEALGMKTIDRSQLEQLHDTNVLIRAHGEPPETFAIARKNNLQVIDTTCPVVQKLQRQIANSYQKAPGAQIVIFGKHGHAEVEGLNGQIQQQSLVVQQEADLEQLDYSRNIIMYSQTTRSIRDFHRFADVIRRRLRKQHPQGAQALELHDTICREVAHRDEELKAFAQKHDKILFVSGRNSSNGKMLYQAAREANPQTYFVSHSKEIDAAWFQDGDDVGISGATSTPRWMMEEAARIVSGTKTPHTDN